MKEYDAYRLAKNLNPTLPKGRVETFLIKYSEDEYEVEFDKLDRKNIQLEGQNTFSISMGFIEVTWTDNTTQNGRL